MLESPTVPRHLVASEGKIYARSEPTIRNYTPRTIDYKHTIRVITPFDCNHEEEICRMRTEKDEAIREKEKEIEGLHAALREKTLELERKNEEIERLKEDKDQQTMSLLKASTLDSKLQRSRLTDIYASNVYSRAVEQVSLSNIKTSYIFDMAPTEHSNHIEEEFQNIENNLKQLASVLSKPKQPYQFFTRVREEPPIALPKRIETLKTQPTISQFESQIICQNPQQDENHDNDNESVECTSTNESFDATDFLQEAIHEHKVLRDTLIELQQSTKTEMQRMRNFYENEIEGYKRLLQVQRGKKCQMGAHQTPGVQKGRHRTIEQQMSSILGREQAIFAFGSSLLDND